MIDILLVALDQNNVVTALAQPTDDEDGTWRVSRNNFATANVVMDEQAAVQELKQAGWVVKKYRYLGTCS